MAKNNTQSGGIGFLGILLLIFITLKLTDHIEWSWWWVMTPMWGPLVLAILVFVIALPLAMLMDERKRRSAKQKIKDIENEIDDLEDEIANREG